MPTLPWKLILVKFDQNWSIHEALKNVFVETHGLLSGNIVSYYIDRCDL
jgi:hypothetical protein